MRLNRHEAITDSASMFTRAWLIGAGELAVVAFAASLLSMLGASQVDVLHADWPTLLAVAGGAALLSLLKSLVSAPVGERGTNFITPGR